jgi:sarcosine oxidase / L-pipecolate oxidase
MPELLDSKLVFARLCLYEDSFDGDFIIDHDPQVEGLMVASGGLIIFVMFSHFI